MVAETVRAPVEVPSVRVLEARPEELLKLEALESDPVPEVTDQLMVALETVFKLSSVTKAMNGEMAVFTAPVCASPEEIEIWEAAPALTLTDEEQVAIAPLVAFSERIEVFNSLTSVKVAMPLERFTAVVPARDAATIFPEQLTPS